MSMSSTSDDIDLDLDFKKIRKSKKKESSLKSIQFKKFNKIYDKILKGKPFTVPSKKTNI